MIAKYYKIIKLSTKKLNKIKKKNFISRGFLIDNRANNNQVKIGV